MSELKEKIRKAIKNMNNQKMSFDRMSVGDVYYKLTASKNGVRLMGIEKTSDERRFNNVKIVSNEKVPDNLVPELRRATGLSLTYEHKPKRKYTKKDKIDGRCKPKKGNIKMKPVKK